MFSHASLRPQATRRLFVSVLFVLVLLVEELLRFYFKEVTLSYLAF
jgi:hypothetical protein